MGRVDVVSSCRERQMKWEKAHDAAGQGTRNLKIETRY